MTAPLAASNNRLTSFLCRVRLPSSYMASETVMPVETHFREETPETEWKGKKCSRRLVEMEGKTMIIWRSFESIIHSKTKTKYPCKHGWHWSSTRTWLWGKGHSGGSRKWRLGWQQCTLQFPESLSEHPIALKSQCWVCLCHCPWARCWTWQFPRLYRITNHMSWPHWSLTS